MPHPLLHRSLLLLLLAHSGCADDGSNTSPSDATDETGELRDTTSGITVAPDGGADTHAPATRDAGIHDPSGCQTADPHVAAANAQELFDYPHVPTFDLVLPPEQWVALQQNARDEEYVSAEACFEGRSIGTIGMRFKGAYGSLYGCFDEQDQLICPRLSMKLDFAQYVDEQRFYGLKRLNFHAYRHDDSRMKERLAYDLYRAMGVVAPRAAWAVLRVNGESLGLYGMVEQLDGRFTKDRWPATPDGNLYKELWPNVTDPGTIAAHLQTNEETAEVSDFSTFSQTFTSATDKELLPTLGEFMNLDYLARYMAVDDAIASYDGVTYFWTDGISTTNHNFYIYEEGPEKYWLIPWDVESTFWINPEHAAPHWTQLPADCSATYPYWEGLANAPACDVFFRALNQDLGRWRAASQELLDGAFSMDAMLANINRHEAFIAAEAHVDPTPAMYVPFDDAVTNLRVTVPALRTRLQALIADAPE